MPVFYPLMDTMALIPMPRFRLPMEPFVVTFAAAAVLKIAGKECVEEISEIQSGSPL
jgi:hypothetical protein